MELSFKDFDLSKNADGLLPVVVQDASTLRVLMLGYMNEEAFDKTRQYQEKRFHPSAFRVGAERLYNTLITGRWLAMVSITLGLLFFALALVGATRQQDNKTKRTKISLCPA